MNGHAESDTAFSSCNLPIINVKIGGIVLKALIDTGATLNVVGNSTYKKLKSVEIIEGPPVELKTITGLTVYSDLILKSKVNIDNYDFETHLVVSGTDLSSAFDIILGLNFFCSHGFTLDCKNCILKNDVISVKWPFSRSFPNGSNVHFTDSKNYDNSKNDDILNEIEESLSKQKSIIGKLITKTCIPPNSQQYISVKLDKECNDMSIGQPLLVEKLNDDHADSFLIARSISNLDDKNSCLALICNLTDSPIHLNKSMQIVKISPIHKIAMVENVNNVTSCNASKQIDWATQVNLTHLNEDQKLKVMDLLSKYNSVFAQDITDLGVCDLIKHEIHLQDQVPTRQKPYRVPYHLKPEMKRQINILLEAGIIQQSTSPFAAPVLLVKKSDGSYRLVADLRKLNAKTIPDNFPLPNLNEMIDNLAGAKFFSTLDLTSGFHQMVMHPDHTKYTAIATEFGLYEYKRLPFGLKNASASFQRLMNLVLAGLNEFQISCYIDDLVIASTDFDGHIDKLKLVFDRLIKANLKVKPSKCSFLKQDITYLGHTVKEGQVFPDKKNLDAIRKAFPPKSRKQVRSFLGLTGFYRKFIPNYSKLALPLTALTRETTKFVWTDKEQAAFDKLKNCLTSEPCLALPDFSKPFSVCTDASTFSLGAVLIQEDDSKFQHPVLFASRKLNNAESKYSIVELEAMAIVFALNQFKNYLYGRHFTVYSDQKCLSQILKLKDPSSKIARWILTLQEFDYTVIYKPGRFNFMADFLSRASYPDENTNSTKQAEINSLELTPSTFNFNFMPVNEIIQRQNKDIYCNNIKSKLNSNFVFHPRSPKFFLKDNLLLCYKNSNDRHSENAKLVVPQSLVHKILNLTHDSDIVAHPGLTRTLKRIKQNYFWHGLYNQVKRYIGSCHSCIQRRGFCKNVNAPVQKIPTADYPFQKVAFDAIGPLVTSKHGNKYIIVISDYFTRYAEAYPLPNIQSSNVAKVLIDFISRHGVMQTLYSDRGSNFLSKAMQEVYDKLGIIKQQTLAFNPRGNGMVERLNKTLIDSLSHLVSVKQEDWCEYLPFALMAFRNAFHTTLKECPSYLVFGRDPVMPYHLVYSDKFRSYSDEPSYAQELVSKLQYSFDLVKENLEKAAEKNSKRNVTLPLNKQIEIGDLVYLHTPKIKIHTSKKLAKLNHGPFRVINKLSPVIFEIQLVNQPAKRQKVHLNRLVKVLEREIFPSIEDNVESNELPVIVNQNDKNAREKDVIEEYPPLCLPYRKISSIPNFNNCVSNNYPVIQTNNASSSHSLPATQSFGSPSSSGFSGDQSQLTPNSIFNASANTSPNLNQGLNVQNTHPYNLRPRNIFGMVKYNNH
ncbi:Retrovirus-related Pol polyprotein from transposon 17.6 [Araneus ventricosus]|uniref:RNA-directed DNA polymerase n=1 Tax=Araneus ventricosus TaxID=182803 RepID=A0A4Y2C387_ARAVE|nr:Retrovirus-related Pol polyprotein from transposon 17.6 [Araneus ventricosus]